MDNIIINLDDGIRLGDDALPRVGDQSSIISQSDTIVGPAGPQGPAGPAGADGQAATITVGSTTTGAAGTNAVVQNSGTSSAAVLDFTIPRGATGATGPQGERGLQGLAGADGQAATITVGSVQTVDPEYPATVQNSGTTSAAVLDFTIPRGNTGETGATGPAGADGQAATITVGTTTTGAEGTNASVTNSGTSSAAVLDFVIPRGATGATGSTGPAGADGQAATITVGSTTTGAAGTSASVTNSGTSSAAVLDFVIPKGDSGVGITTLTDNAGREGYYFDDGLLICRRTVSFNVAINTAWGSLYRGVNPDYYSFIPSGADYDFISKPTVSITPLAGGTSSYFMGAWENGAIVKTGQWNVWAIPTGSLSFLRPNTSSSTPVLLEIIAIGKWK